MNRITSIIKIMITLAVLFSTILFMGPSCMARDRFSLKFENVNLMYHVGSEVC